MEQRLQITSVDGSKLSNEDFEMAQSIVKDNNIKDSSITIGNVKITVGEVKGNK